MKSLVPPARIELAAHGLGICTWAFYGFFHSFISINNIGALAAPSLFLDFQFFSLLVFVMVAKW
jgi:hypothetical protein